MQNGIMFALGIVSWGSHIGVGNPRIVLQKRQFQN
jgi:hypothetical protein